MKLAEDVADVKDTVADVKSGLTDLKASSNPNSNPPQGKLTVVQSLLRKVVTAVIATVTFFKLFSYCFPNISLLSFLSFILLVSFRTC